jgi:hypothetical protein
MQPQPSQLIRAAFLSAPAEVKKLEPRSGYYLLEVVLDDRHHTLKPLRITAEQLAQIQGLERNPVALTADAEDLYYLRRKQGNQFTILPADGQLRHALEPQLPATTHGSINCYRLQWYTCAYGVIHQEVSTQIAPYCQEVIIARLDDIYRSF